MSKKLSISILLSMSLFMLLTFTTSKFQNNFGENDIFGYPFVFFTANNGKEFINSQSFSLLSLTLDLGICFGICFGTISALTSVFKVERNHKQALAA